MRAVNLILVCLAFVALSSSERISYDNFKVYRVSPVTNSHLETLKLFNRYGNHVDFWNEPHSLGQHVDVMVAPHFQNIFTTLLKFRGIDYVMMIPDVEKVVQEEHLRQLNAPTLRSGRINFKNYHRFGAINDYINLLAKEHSDIVSVEYPATSSEGREVTMIKISTGGSNKPAIFVDAGIHAREWIAPAMALYMINQLVENPDNRHMIENVDWFIIPVLNPDGYEYSHTSDRMWRKTRSPGKVCDGVDGNRNFDFHWMEVGASASECAETYAGPKPMSEPETNALKKTLNEHGANIKLYLTFHSYGNYLLYPWGYTSSLPDNWPELQSLAEGVEKAIRSVSGTRYTIGSSTNVLYAAAGGSDDWVKAVGGVELSYTIELPGGGWQGFDLPPEEIDPVVKETWEGVKVYHQYIADKFSN